MQCSVRSGRAKGSTGVYGNVFVSVGSAHDTPGVVCCAVDSTLVSCRHYADVTVSGSAPCQCGLRTWLMIHLAASAASPSTDSGLTDEEEAPTQSVP